ncbi:ATP-binding protein [Hydrogenophaga sp. PAMC20947]|uniref:AAA family ATPase n=1 Tax=Hydrogenophaga sp. PAMC20947 TaxID=2565558 RepID=UPI00109E228A|nr:ATP-binding protein [Hydrogenophaga sp. PAMC20947]QCB47825.1 ATP-binding protein [Hydrogenophaga sp. PAMC20947]
MTSLALVSDRRQQPQLHFMCGKAGAGKSVLAKAVAEAADAVVLSEDVWLARLFGDELVTFDDYVKFSRRTRLVVAPLVIDVLRDRSVVLDFPANTLESRTWFRSIFESANRPHTLHYLVASDALCLQRIGRRNVERPEGSHALSEAMFHRITSFFQPPGTEERFNVQLHPQGLEVF